jgi:hypothetical protein
MWFLFFQILKTQIKNSNLKQIVNNNSNNNNNNNNNKTDRTIPNNKPDIIIRDNEKRTCMLIDFAISGVTEM